MKNLLIAIIILTSCDNQTFYEPISIEQIETYNELIFDISAQAGIKTIEYKMTVTENREVSVIDREYHFNEGTFEQSAGFFILQHSEENISLDKVVLKVKAHDGGYQSSTWTY